MFRRDPVEKFDSLFQIRHDDDSAIVAQSLLDHLGPGQFLRLANHLRLDLPRQLRNRRYADRSLETGAVFRLGEQIRGNVARLRLRVGQHHDLRGTGYHLNPHDPVHLLLGRHRVRAARADDHIHLGDGLRAERHRPYGLGSADPVHLVEPQEPRRAHDVRMRSAVHLGRRNHADLLDPCHLSRHSGHQQTRDQRRLSPRHADADALDRDHLLAQDDPVPVLHEPRVRLLPLVEGADIGGRRLDGRAQFGI